MDRSEESKGVVSAKNGTDSNVQSSRKSKRTRGGRLETWKQERTKSKSKSKSKPKQEETIEAPPVMPSAVSTTTTTTNTTNVAPPTKPPAPSFRRPLSRSALAAALASAKPTSLVDTSLSSTSTITSSRNPLPPPPSSASSSIGLNVRSISWSPLGTHLATADPRILRVWNPDRPSLRYSTELKPPPGSMNTTGPSGKPIPTPAHMTGTERIAFRPSSTGELASVGSDSTLRFWDVRARSPLCGSIALGDEGFSLAWRSGTSQRDSDELLIGLKNDVLLPIDRRSMGILARHPQSVQTNQVSFTNAGNHVLLTTGDGSVKLVPWTALTTPPPPSNLEPLHVLNAHTSACSIALQCPKGRHIATGGSDALVTVWETQDWTSKYGIGGYDCPGMTGPVRSLSWSWDGSFLTWGSDEGTGVVVAHAETGEVVTVVPTAHSAPCVAWGPGRYVLAYSGDPGGVKVVGVS
ncbi:MAG: hypothetical protein M1828_006086 [Chrysothrix sp. TS-e1954]|nr:MAG: hypothetical protein M1828_006086 [Chrysothrix sp. TS-e1954]